jgi:hypothetical protein
MLHIILFIATFVTLSILTVVKNPAFSFALYEIVYFFYPQGRWWGNSLPDISYSFLAVILMAGALFIDRRKNRSDNHKFFAVPQNRCILLILILFAISTIYSPDVSRHITFLTNFLKLVITYFIAFKLINDLKKLDIAIWGHLFGAWYLSFLVFQTGRNSGDRVEGLGTVDAPDANGLASTLVAALVLSFHYFLFTKHYKYKFLFAVAGLFVAKALIQINSRGAFLGAGAAVLYYSLHLYNSSIQFKHQKLTVTIILTISLLGASQLVDESSYNRFNSIFTGEISTEVESERTRTYFWSAAIDMAKDYPLGTGINGFIYYSPRYLPTDINVGGSRNRAVHSTWFEALSEIGYLGLLALILMVFFSYRSISKCRNNISLNLSPKDYYRLIAIQSALIAFVITMTFLNRLRADILYWCILYTACAYSIYQSKILADIKSQETKSLKNPRL